MAYDEKLAARVAAALSRRVEHEERKMFGGIAFMIGGKMAIGVSAEDLMVRVGPDAHEGALAQPGARPMDFTGRPMKGYVFVGPAGTATAPALMRWIDRALAFNTVALARSPRRRK